MDARCPEQLREPTLMLHLQARRCPSIILVAAIVAAAGCGTGGRGTSNDDLGAPIRSVSINPPSATVALNETLTFVATVDGASAAVTWSISEGAVGGTVTPEGVYTAPTLAGTYHVVATSVVDKSKSAESTVTVTVPTVIAEPDPEPTPIISSPEALRMADWLLSNQDANGALQDYHGGRVCNEDSNMEYALLGLAAAYASSKEARYLTGLENGIRWLAARQDMSATRWRGSWFYVYDCFPPYAPIQTSPGPGVTDVRGVDSTSALFVYLLYIQRQLSGSDAMATLLAANAHAALDFLMANNMDADGLTFSSWQLADGTWRLWRYKYTADQADVYLGLHAGWLLYGAAGERYEAAANVIRQKVPALMFDHQANRYAEGLDEWGDLDYSAEFDATFPQGYVPWVFGASPQNLAAHGWLLAGVQPDGSLALYAGDPGYSLSADLLAMSAAALSLPWPASSMEWLLSTGYDTTSGAVRDTGAPGSDEISNVAGFTIVSLLRQSPFGW